MIVVSDTSPITTLLKVDKIKLLFELFDRVIVPNAVRDELLRTHPTLPTELKFISATDTATIQRLKGQLDPGEAEAITLAKELKADAVLIDEKKGRRIAAQEGVVVVGLLAVIVMAREKRAIPSVKNLLDDLETRGGFYVSEQMRQRTLREAGEE